MYNCTPQATHHAKFDFDLCMCVCVYVCMCSSGSVRHAVVSATVVSVVVMLARLQLASSSTSLDITALMMSTPIYEGLQFISIIAPAAA